MDATLEHEFVLLEEVVGGQTTSNTGLPVSVLPPPNQRLVGMQEMPLQVRNKWKNETKFILKRVGTDPSWRARLGNLLAFSEEQSADSSPAGAGSR
jgi:phosphatidylinositol phospholipase C epsilon